MGAAHLESFDFFLQRGIQNVLENLNPYEFELQNGEKLKLVIENCSISEPRVPGIQIDVRERKIFPTECRQRASTYSGKCTLTLGWYKNDAKQASIDFEMGDIPVMVKVRKDNRKNINIHLCLFSM